MTDKTSKNKNVFKTLAIIIVGIAVAGVIYQYTRENSTASKKTPSATLQNTAKITQSDDEQPIKNNAYNAADVLNERILGNPNAPIKITEYSSLTCGHCANFHKTDFPQLKAEYIDTGKAYLVFSDFPLNGAAVHASLAARCADKSQYFDFIDRLFAEQENWAFDLVNYKSKLKTIAKDFGLNEGAFEVCINNKELQRGLLDKRTQASRTHQVNSTPSFIINGETKLGGHELLDHLANMQ